MKLPDDMRDAVAMASWLCILASKVIKREVLITRVHRRDGGGSSYSALPNTTIEFVDVEDE